MTVFNSLKDSRADNKNKIALDSAHGSIPGRDRDQRILKGGLMFEVTDELSQCGSLEGKLVL